MLNMDKPRWAESHTNKGEKRASCKSSGRLHLQDKKILKKEGRQHDFGWKSGWNVVDYQRTLMKLWLWSMPKMFVAYMK